MAQSPIRGIRAHPATRWVGLLLVAAGVVLIAVLSVAEIASDGQPVAATTVTTAQPPTTGMATTTITAEPATTTTEAAPTTSEATTTSQEPPETTTTTSTTTTTQPEVAPPTPDEQVAEFVADVFVKALEEQDAETLLDHLHPAVIATFGEDACRSFVETTILLIETYAVDGEVEVGMEAFEIDEERVVVDPTFTVPVEFVFLGETFSENATFAPVADPGAALEMTWFTACA